MHVETIKMTKEIQEIAESLICKVTGKMPEEERIKIAIEIQRNKILKEELSAIYEILDDIRCIRSGLY